jgi:exodeoxyribonuclease V beta subunit
VMGRTTRDGEKSSLHLCGLGYLLGGGQEILTADLPARLAALQGGCTDITLSALPPADDSAFRPLAAEQVQLARAEAFVAGVPRDWRIASYSGLRVASPAEAAAAGTVLVTAADSAAEAYVLESAGETAKVPGGALSDRVAGPGDPRSIHTFPRGPEPGTFLHGLLEWAAQEGFGALADDRPRLAVKVQLLCRRRGWDEWVDTLTDWLLSLLRTPLPLPGGAPAVALANLDTRSYQSELEFLMAVHQVNTVALDQAVGAAIVAGASRPVLLPDRLNGMLKGYIDFVFCHAGRYYVVDYKSNYLGADARSYDRSSMTECILAHRYDLQYTLYTLALHRLLKARLPDYDYARDVGGVIYLFLRGAAADGTGVYVDTPPAALIRHLDAAMLGEEGR